MVFKADTRKAVYALVIVAFCVLIGFGLITGDELSKTAEAITQIVAALTASLALLNVAPDTKSDESPVEEDA